MTLQKKPSDICIDNYWWGSELCQHLQCTPVFANMCNYENAIVKPNKSQQYTPYGCQEYGQKSQKKLITNTFGVFRTIIQVTTKSSQKK